MGQEFHPGKVKRKERFSLGQADLIKK